MGWWRKGMVITNTHKWKEYHHLIGQINWENKSAQQNLNIDKHCGALFDFWHMFLVLFYWQIYTTSTKWYPGLLWKYTKDILCQISGWPSLLLLWFPFKAFVLPPKLPPSFHRKHRKRQIIPPVTFSALNWHFMATLIQKCSKSEVDMKCLNVLIRLVKIRSNCR